METAAPLFYVSPAQINFQVPFGVSSSATVLVMTNGVLTLATSVRIEPASPGIFTGTRGGAVQAAVLNQDASPNSAANPAAAGSVIQIFTTGLGATNPPLSTGQPGASAAPLNQVVAAPLVFLSGAPAEVLLAGAAPGFVGLYQVNARVPAGTPAGSAVPLVLSANGFTSNTAVIAVRTAAP